jgi:hypothetical protein
VKGVIAGEAEASVAPRSLMETPQGAGEAASTATVPNSASPLAGKRRPQSGPTNPPNSEFYGISLVVKAVSANWSPQKNSLQTGKITGDPTHFRPAGRKLAVE